LTEYTPVLSIGRVKFKEFGFGSLTFAESEEG